MNISLIIYLTVVATILGITVILVLVGWYTLKVEKTPKSDPNCPDCGYLDEIVEELGVRINKKQTPPKTREQLWQLLYSVCPSGDMQYDNSGQLIFYTGLMSNEDQTGLMPFDSDISEERSRKLAAENLRHRHYNL